MKKIFYGYFWSDLYHDIKSGLKSLFIYLPIIWKMRDWDYMFILQMQEFQIKRLHDYIKKHKIEVDENRIPKEKDMERCLELLNNIIEDNYIDRLGGLHSFKYSFEFEKVKDKEDLYTIKESRTEEEIKEDSEKMIKSHEMEREEWDELWDIIKKGKNYNWGLNSWWD